jgi:aromatic-amino-acid transaminase
VNAVILAEVSQPRILHLRTAERHWVDQSLPKNYRPIEGTKGFRDSVQSLIFGADAAVVREGRAATLQSLGGTGALKIGADVLKAIVPEAKVAISNPSWENHRALFLQAGFKVVAYPYYSAERAGIDFEAMLDFLRVLPKHSIV